MQARVIEKYSEDLGRDISPSELLKRARSRKRDLGLYDLFLQHDKEPFEGPRFLQGSLIEHIRLTRRIAVELIDESGALNQGRLKAWIVNLEKEHNWRSAWTLEALKILPAKALDQVYAPDTKRDLRVSFGLKIIRETLGAAENSAVTDADAKRAALAAFLTDLRQEVGSCFATAPARLIRAELPERFFKDIKDLLSLGFLRRILDGIEIEIPAASNWGRGGVDTPFLMEQERSKITHALTEVSGSSFLFVWRRIKRLSGIQTVRQSLASLKSPYESQWLVRLRALTICPLAKVWEYTLASMSDIKLDFVHWNSFHALGIDLDHEKGLGTFLKEKMEGRLEHLNSDIEDINHHIHMSEQHLNSIGIRAKNATSESDFMYLKSASNAESARLSGLIAERGALNENASRLSQMLGPLLKGIGTAFTEEFAEVFDPDLNAGEENLAFISDDRAAGFRLAYKHGRRDPASWTQIKNAEEWRHTLSLFFGGVPAKLGHLEPFDALSPREFQLMMGWVQHWLGELDFVEAAIARCNSNRKGATPWTSVSGGTVHYLLSVYFELPLDDAFRGLKEEVKKPSSSEELFAFLLESAFSLPLGTKDHLIKKPFSGLILLAPEHCATFHPQWSTFYEGWRREQYPYTWVRDHVVECHKERLASFRFDSFTAQAFLERLGPLRINIGDRWSPAQMKRALLPHFPSDFIDMAIYSWLPIVRGDQLDRALAEMSIELGIEKKHSFSKVNPHASFTKLELFDCMRLLGASDDTCLELAARHLGYSLATSLPFSDSNWTREYLSFVLSPTSLKLEVWRTEPGGSSGAPMSQWMASGKRWSVFLRAFFTFS